MNNPSGLNTSSRSITSIIGSPFEWCPITGGVVILGDASQEGGTKGGECTVVDFWMAKYPVTNHQYQRFIDEPNGFRNAQWWDFSPQAQQWHVDHPHPKPTAFSGDHLPRTRVSWFDSMAFCAWLYAELKRKDPQLSAGVVRLPTEPEWQRAAMGDTNWTYPWGNEMDKLRGNFGNNKGRPTPVDQYFEGKSPYEVMDLVGNVWEWCLTNWGEDIVDLSGYTYRAMRGGAWNVSNLEYLCATNRYGHPPRGQLNDGGFRIVCADSFP